MNPAARELFLVGAGALAGLVGTAGGITSLVSYPALLFASAVLFALFAHVDWTVVAPLAAGLFAGSLLGPRAAPRLPPGLLRWLVALSGLALAVRLLVSWPALDEASVTLAPSAPVTLSML